MFSSPIKTRRTPAWVVFSMKLGMRWHSVSTWIVKPIFNPSPRSSIRRSTNFSQSRLRAKLSSVMKKRLMPWATFSRTSRSRSSAERNRLLRPCTLMIVQKEH
jgi:hypothetical protein